jgi:hypothetical protein
VSSHFGEKPIGVNYGVLTVTLELTLANVGSTLAEDVAVFLENVPHFKSGMAGPRPARCQHPEGLVGGNLFEINGGRALYPGTEISL